MSISAGELAWYWSYGMTGSPIQPYTDPGTSPLTGNEGGGLTANELAQTLNEFFRSVRGTDVASADFYDYNKIYWANDNGSLNFLNGGIYVYSKSSYTQDQMAVALGLTDGAYTIDNAGTGEFSDGREDYDEETSGATPINSPYPRVTGAGNEAASLLSTYSVDGGDAVFDGTMREYRIGSLPDAIDNDVYVKVVGLDDNNNIVVGYADLTDDGGTAYNGTSGLIATNTAVFKDSRDVSGTDIEIARPLYFSVHNWRFEGDPYGGSGTQVVSQTGMSGADGDLRDIQTTAAEDIIIQVSAASGNWGTPTTIASIRSGDGTDVGQIFVPVFYPESTIDTIGEALLFPTIGPSVPANGFDQNEFGEQRRPHIALWLRRKLDQTAGSQASVLNRLKVFGDSA